MISTWRRNRRTHTVGVFVAGLTALGLAACSGSPSTTGTGSRQGGPAAPNPNPGVGAPGAPASAGAGAPGADSRGVASPAPTSRPTSTRDFSMTDPAKDRLSTFALDIDTGSYTRFRDATNRGQRVSPNEVRTEEFVNYFEQEYAAPADGLDVRVDAATLPFGDHHTIVRVGVRSADVTDSARPDADLSLVVDCSGSMADGNKMPMTKAALTTLLRSLRPTDKVAIVCYSTTARVLLPPTPASERDGIQRAIDSLRPEQSTNAEAGLDLGYQQARAMATSGRMTRVILVSDGVANVGATVGSPAAATSASTRKRSAAGSPHTRSESRDASSIPVPTASPCSHVPYPVAVSIAWPNVCPKLRSARSPVSRSSAATISALTRQLSWMACASASSSRSRSARMFRSSQSKKAASRIAPYLTTSASPAVTSRAGSVARQPVSTSTATGWWNAPIMFLPRRWLTAVLPPTEESVSYTHLTLPTKRIV